MRQFIHTKKQPGHILAMIFNVESADVLDNLQHETIEPQSDDNEETCTKVSVWDNLLLSSSQTEKTSCK